MKLRLILNRIYIKYSLLRFFIYRYLFGFHNATKLFNYFNKKSVIPVLKKYGAIIGQDCDIETGLKFHNCRSFLNLIIGKNCHIGKECFFDLRDKIIIGDNCVISMQTTFITHIDMEKSPLSKYFPSDKKPVIIENGVYIGAKSTILMGIKIKQNSIVAAGSVVNNNIDTNSLVGGVPAKEIKKIK